MVDCNQHPKSWDKQKNQLISNNPLDLQISIKRMSCVKVFGKVFVCIIEDQKLIHSFAFKWAVNYSFSCYFLFCSFGYVLVKPG